MHWFYIPPFGIIFISLLMGIVICLLLLPGLQEVIRSKGLLTFTTKDQSIYPAGIIWFISSILPSLLFSQFVIPHPSFLIFIACALLLLFFSLRSDLLKVYSLQWVFIWFVIAIILNDLGNLRILSTIPGINETLAYWIGLLLLFIVLTSIHFLLKQHRISSVQRSFCIIPSLLSALIYLMVVQNIESTLLPAGMIGSFIALFILNLRNHHKQFDPGTTSTILTGFTLLWLNLIQPMETQFFFLIIWLIPLILTITLLRITRSNK